MHFGPDCEEFTGNLAADGFAKELAHELGGADRAVGRLLLKAGPPRPAAWAQNIWLDPRVIAIESIADGARKLRSIQRNWAVYAPLHHRRATLIQERLPVVSAKPLVFPTPPPAAPLGSWTLLDPNTIVAAPKGSSPFPNGEVQLASSGLAHRLAVLG